MNKAKRTPQRWNLFLWIAQGLLAASMIWAAAMKLFQPIEKLAEMWPWVAEVPVWLVKSTGLVDLLGGLGLILPALLRINPRLTSVAAVAVILLMVCASVFHLSRGEASAIAPNIVFAILALFIAWGRARKVPIIPR